jgi:hypothetical protein
MAATPQPETLAAFERSRAGACLPGFGWLVLSPAGCWWPTWKA